MLLLLNPKRLSLSVQEQQEKQVCWLWVSICTCVEITRPHASLFLVLGRLWTCLKVVTIKPQACWVLGAYTVLLEYDIFILSEHPALLLEDCVTALPSWSEGYRTQSWYRDKFQAVAPCLVEKWLWIHTWASWISQIKPLEGIWESFLSASCFVAF